MLKLFLDADTPEALAKALKSAGFVVVRSQEVGLGEADDLAQIQWASEHGYVLFTFDVKTMPKAVMQWQAMGCKHSGVIFCEQMPRDAIGVIVRRLLNLAKVHNNETLKNVTLHLGAVWD
ncbi:MAG: DUF5615 family PIN-like protein [Armatimonadota bacterium]|nr:DUF5615 family PIN-like protein [Armatimonadota bacterium]MDW8142156.1 DUF5615 family PIN-like protein [Armatimonadota bacterium]